MTGNKYWKCISYSLKEDGAVVNIPAGTTYSDYLKINPQKYLYMSTVETLVKQAFEDGKDAVNTIEFDDTLLIVNGIYKGKFGKLIAYRYETSAEKYMGASAIIIVDGKYEIEVPLKDCRKIIT